MTDWMTGEPARPGWYSASTERNDQMRAHWDGRSWSRQVDADASEDAHDAARATPMHDERARRLEWRGVTAPCAAWLAHELAHEPA